MLLSSPYSEGCPAHPSYPAGHAAIAGAAVTVLKAFFFDESAILPDCVEAAADGLTLSTYSTSALSVGDELNKLAKTIRRRRYQHNQRTEFEQRRLELRLVKQISRDAASQLRS
jgi:hypothetical protein